MKMQTKKLDMQKLLAPAALILQDGRLFGSPIDILNRAAPVALLAIGMTLVIATGGIDLSLGTVMMCAALLGGYSFKQGWPLILSVLLTIFVGAAFGFINGNLIARLHLPPFIATLGTQMMAAGLGSIITKVQSQTWPTATAEVGSWFKKVFIRADIFGVKGFPVGAFWLIGFFLIAMLILHKTRFGRYAFAIGSNEEATRLSGIKVDKWKVAVYTLSGFFIGMSGLFYAAAYTTITPGTGAGQEMNGITGVIIGGTSMSGGSGSMVGTLIGVFIMSVLKTGLSACNLQAPWQTFLTGAVVIGAVLLDIARTNAANRVKKG